jgi:RHS repeat-associated protein
MPFPTRKREQISIMKGLWTIAMKTQALSAHAKLIGVAIALIAIFWTAEPAWAQFGCAGDHWVYSGTVALAKGGPGCQPTQTTLGAPVWEAWPLVGPTANGACPFAEIDVDTKGGSLADGSYRWFAIYPGYMNADPTPSASCGRAPNPEECNAGCLPPPEACARCEGGFAITLYAIDEHPELRQCGSGPPPNVGEPINVVNGNVWFDQSDTFVQGIVGIPFVRSYNSLNAVAGISGSLGKGWSHSFERKLIFPPATPKIIKLRGDDADVVYFEDADGNQLFEALVPATEESSLLKSGGSYTRSFRRGGSEVYDLQGRLTSVVDPAGNTITLLRDGAGRLTGIADPGSRSLTLSYDSDGKLASLSGPQGGIASYSYAPSTGVLQRVDYADGSGYTFTYDSRGGVLSVMDATGRLLEEHTYDNDGRGLTSSLANGREKYTLVYDNVHSTIEVTDALGHETTYTWSGFGGIHRRLTSIVGPCVSCGGGGSQTQTFDYDNEGRLLSETDGLGHSTTYVYDSNGDRVSETNALNQTTTYTHDAQGRVLTRSGPDGSLTTYTYAPGGPLTITEKLSATQSRTTSITYNGQGKAGAITDPRSKTTTLAYNSAGDLTSVTDPLNHATTFGYDSMGRRTTVTDALNHTTTTTYDSRGRVTRITSADQTKTDFGYDLGGRRTSVTDPMGRTTRYVYDSYGRLESVIDPLNGVTRYGYNLMSSLTSLTDAKGQTTSFQYDAYNRVSSVTSPGGGQETYTYNAAGRLATRTDRKSVVTTYSYDELGRLNSKSYSNGDPSVSYTYDLGGHLATAVNGTDTLTWTYDLAGQVLSEESSKNASTVAYAYDLDGNRLEVKLDGQVFVTYAYDDASRLTSITRGSNVFGFGYDNANRRTSMSYPNGVTTGYTYDDLNRLLRLKADLGATPITDFQYVYDAAGNRTSKQQLDFTEAYAYDKLSRLTGVERTGGSTSRWLYSYDPVGNRLSEQINDAVSSSTFNVKNQLISTTGGGPLRWRGTLNEPGNVSFSTVMVNGQSARMLPGNVFEANVEMAAGNNNVTVQATDVSGNVTTKSYLANVTGASATYSYDLNGNLVQKVEGADTWNYEWNAENQLTRVTKNAVERARFKYDPLGRRVERAATGETTTWTLDGEDILREGNGSTTLKYVQGPGIDEPLATDNGSAFSYFQADGLGSVVKSTSSAGDVTLTRRYDAWGSLEVGALNGYAFTAREWDSEIGLAYYRARYYDAKVGRFLSEDPIGFDGGPNFYSYVGNSPVIYADPFGLERRPNGDRIENHDSVPYNGWGERTDGSTGPMLIPPAIPPPLPGYPVVPGIPPAQWDVDYICTPDGWRQVSSRIAGRVRVKAGRISPVWNDWTPDPNDLKKLPPCPERRSCSSAGNGTGT